MDQFKNKTAVIWRLSINDTVQGDYMAVNDGYMAVNGGYIPVNGGYMTYQGGCKLRGRCLRI